MLIGFSWVQSVFCIVSQTSANEVLCLFRYFVLLRRIRRKSDLCSITDYVLLQNLVLWHSVPKRSLPVKHLKENDTNWPHIDFWRDHRIIRVESFRRQVPVSANSLRSQIDFCLVAIAIHFFAKPKVQDFDDSFVKDDIAWFKIIVNDLILEFVEVVKCA